MYVLFQYQYNLNIIIFVANIFQVVTSYFYNICNTSTNFLSHIADIAKNECLVIVVIVSYSIYRAWNICNNSDLLNFSNLNLIENLKKSLIYHDKVYRYVLLYWIQCVCMSGRLSLDAKFTP